MKYIRLYSGDDGQSHFEELSMDWIDAAIGKISQPFNISDAMFGYVEDVPEISWHNPPCRQYIILLKGSMEIEVGSGISQVFNEGDVLLAEDTVGQGHITRPASEGPRHYLALPLKN
jgi:hypothetical protein